MAQAPSASVPAEPALPAPESASASGAARPEPPEPALSSAAELFERATALRRAEDVVGARRSYQELATRFPGTPEARIGLAVLARLELDLGDAASALRDFDAYLATGDLALREESLAGRALALGELGRTVDQCDAFAALQRAYPATLYQRLAVRRCGPAP